MILKFHFRYIGDENGMVFVLKYDAGERKLIQLPYLVPAESIAGESLVPSSINKSLFSELFYR